MNERPLRHDVSRNCQRPEAEEEGFLAPEPDCRRSRVPPLSRARTQRAKDTKERGKVEANCTTRRVREPDRDGLLRANSRSSLLGLAESAGIVVDEPAWMAGVLEVVGIIGSGEPFAVGEMNSIVAATSDADSMDKGDVLDGATVDGDVEFITGR
jgi:hypothetical protein